MIALLGRALRSLGLEVRRYRPSSAGVLQRELRRHCVDTIFDIGANTGQSALFFRSLGYGGKIVSFEPVEHLFRELAGKARCDPRWQAEKLALGSEPGSAEIRVTAGHGGASSLLEMTDNVRANAPDQRVVDRQRIEIATLASMLDKHYPQGERCFLKLDVQGYERNVLASGLDRLHRVIGMKVELSLVENYKGESLLHEMLPFLYGLGFRAVCFEDGWQNATTGELYQVDLTLFRHSSRNAAR